MPANVSYLSQADHRPADDVLSAMVQQKREIQCVAREGKMMECIIILPSSSHPPSLRFSRSTLTTDVRMGTVCALAHTVSLIFAVSVLLVSFFGVKKSHDS